MTVPGRKGDTVVDRDEHIRPDTTVETLAKLRPIMGRSDPEATVTAGNASGQNDGAAVCVVTHPERAAELGLRPLARLVSWGVAGVPPADDGHRPGAGDREGAGRGRPHAGRHRPDRAERGLRRPGARRAPREWGFADADFERLNVNGSGISLGHPVGATGGRILATLLREMDRRERPLRPGDDVHRRRPGPGRGVRADGLMASLQPTDELADAVSTALIRLVRLLERGRAQYQAENPDAVERATYLLLVHLVKDGPQRAGALAEAVHSDPSTISRQIAHLVKLGLVERMADPVDGRATLLAATDEGRRVFEENRRLRNERFARSWPTGRRRTGRRCATMLARLADDIEGLMARTTRGPIRSRVLLASARQPRSLRCSV